eukprot:TRINITY_DN15326_c0_g1_i2.p1 TRINITY_DN15326_c0_g1~~TRINITY_DN15326_c0_g1_i2.p1  ORF type:complete len:203 (-),score=31.98 TRINITY_DN15326_c0_g1_i2:128-736(-)
MVANSQAFYDPITKADLIWIGGGRQWRCADSYLRTGTLVAMHDLLKRGGVVGGTSAGASIQSDYLVRGDRKGNRKVIGDHLEGFGFLQNIGIDQHVVQKNRHRDLTQFVKAYPYVLGIAIDENTGIVFKKDIFEVIGTSCVLVHDNTLWNAPAHIQDKRCGKCRVRGEKYIMLTAGDRYNVKTRKLLLRGNMWENYRKRGVL